MFFFLLGRSMNQNAALQPVWQYQPRSPFTGAPKDDVFGVDVSADLTIMKLTISMCSHHG